MITIHKKETKIDLVTIFRYDGFSSELITQEKIRHVSEHFRFILEIIVKKIMQ
jgi:hypothetical protein